MIFSSTPYQASPGPVTEQDRQWHDNCLELGDDLLANGLTHLSLADPEARGKRKKRLLTNTATSLVTQLEPLCAGASGDPHVLMTDGPISTYRYF